METVQGLKQQRRVKTMGFKEFYHLTKDFVRRGIIDKTVIRDDTDILTLYALYKETEEPEEE